MPADHRTAAGATCAGINDPQSAWAPYRPDAQRPWDLRRAGHLLRRAGFGAGWPQLQRALADGPQRTIDRLFQPESELEAFNRAYDEHEAAEIDPDSASADALRQWWLRRMMLTPQPLLEKMTLFWHNHFAVSAARTGNGRLVARHVQLLRSHALGRVQGLLEAVARDPAALLSVGAAGNPKSRPNENFARTFFEDYTLGPGVASAEDVRQAARAWTGAFVLRRQYQERPAEHESGPKRILGRTGDFQGDDVVRLALARPETARRLVRKLYRWLVSEIDEPEDALLAPLAELLAEQYDVSQVTQAILRSNLFFSPAAYRRRVKSPIEFALGIILGLEGTVPTNRLAADLADLGQRLGDPPTSAGWEGGRAWLNPATLLARNNLALALVSGSGPYGEKLDLAAGVKRHGGSGPEATAGFLADLFLQGDVPAGVRPLVRQATGARTTPEGLRQAAHLVLALPEFQLA